MPNSTRCMLCHATSFKVIHQKGQWQYLQCLNCDLVSLFPRPSPQALVTRYQSYLPTKLKEISRWETMMNPVVVKSANLIESVATIRKGRLLDVGCGYGFFLGEMKARGWQVEGVEVSQSGRQYMEKKWNISVHPRPLEDLGFAESVFDVVTLFYLIEHVHDPLKLLVEVKRVLKPGGLVLLRWPHSTPIVKALGPVSRKFDLYHTPYHLYDFSPKTITNALVRCGFDKPQTIIGGYTKPDDWLERWASAVFGQLAEVLYLLSGGSILFPGISKTTLAFKAISPPVETPKPALGKRETNSP